MKTIKLKILQRESGFPSYTSLYNARWNPEFSDVKHREKHFHVRRNLHTCLTTVLFNVRSDIKKRVEYERLLKEHSIEIKKWRTYETHLFNHSKSSPEKLIVLSYDDTNAMGFPRTTGIHNLPTDKVLMTPFNLTNHGTGENIYMYNFTHKWKKGQDRICSLLYVHRGWFDEIEMYFGPVGHTHNGATPFILFIIRYVVTILLLLVTILLNYLRIFSMHGITII